MNFVYSVVIRFAFRRFVIASTAFAYALFIMYVVFCCVIFFCCVIVIIYIVFDGVSVYVMCVVVFGVCVFVAAFFSRVKI